MHTQIAARERSGHIAAAMRTIHSRAHQIAAGDLNSRLEEASVIGQRSGWPSASHGQAQLTLWLRNADMIW
jgi:hypothetical protein